MSELFLKIVNMSICASWLVLAVLLLRLVLKKVPKWVSVLLWGFVAVRLICPFSVESVLSLIPSAETVSPEIMMDRTPEISAGIEPLDTLVNPFITQSFAPKPYASANPLQILIPLAAVVWIAGIAVMLIYTAVSYLLLRRKVATAVLLRDNIYQSENVASPFVLGIIKPKIYLPFQMDGQNLEYVIAHEQSHIRRKDHLWKPLGFLLLAIHWFNPLVWLGYILLCRDIELACDEKVIKEMDSETKADYTQALVSCSVNRRSIAACPLAFGEVGVKERVKSVMHYKKPAFWIIVAAVVTCAAVAVCFLTDPVDSIGMTKLSYDEVHMPGLLKDVREMKLIYNGASITCSEEDTGKILAILDEIQVSTEPISRDRSQDRSKDFTVVINGNKLHFNKRFTEFWEDNNVKPSLTHRIFNPSVAKGLVEEYERIALSQNATEELQQTQLENETDSLGEVISAAILEKNAGDRFLDVPTGAIHTHSYRIFAMESESGTPLIHQDNYMTQTTVYIHYLYIRYYYSGGALEERGSTCTPAAITFSIDPEEGYTVKEFWEPNPGEGSDDEVREKFPKDAAEEILDPGSDWLLSGLMERECYAQATEYLAQIYGNAMAFMAYYDSIGYDIDGDGKTEMCTLTYGPTSGLYSFTFLASPIEPTASSPKYTDYFVLGYYYDLSFVVDDGVVRIKGENEKATPQTVYFDISVKDGHIVLHCEDEDVLWFTQE